MSYRLQQSLSERPCATRNLPSQRSESTPPFSFSTTTYRYAETDCVSASRRRRVTMHLEGVRYYGMRYYNPDWGRWVNRDPLGDEMFFKFYTQGMRWQRREMLRDQSRSPSYLFVFNNSVMFIDYLGLELTAMDCGKCSDMGAAIDKVNDALNEGECRQWFEDHGHDYSGGLPSRTVKCHGNWKIMCCLKLTAAWTMPGMRIGVCNNQCNDYGAAGLASLLIHELAHHYCTWVFGR